MTTMHGPNCFSRPQDLLGTFINFGLIWKQIKMTFIIFFVSLLVFDKIDGESKASTYNRNHLF
jgi:hypothetical protein